MGLDELLFWVLAWRVHFLHLIIKFVLLSQKHLRCLGSRLVGYPRGERAAFERWCADGVGKEGKGRERKGKEGKGRERKGKEGKEGKGRDRKETEGKGRERKGKKGKEQDAAHEPECSHVC